VFGENGPKESGRFEEYPAHDIPADASFLEMLDIVNEGLIAKNVEPIAFDHDCREGICGTCSFTINGVPHGPGRAQPASFICESSMIVTLSPWNHFGRRRFPCCAILPSTGTLLIGSFKPADLSPSAAVLRQKP
jgi:succinate dehydrogenase/fumarate reductase-like Fe-S protein